MFVDGGGWRPSWEPPPRAPRPTRQPERVILWLILINVFLLLVAPIGGVTIVQAVVASLAGR